jgi:hypothetical protein
MAGALDLFDAIRGAASFIEENVMPAVVDAEEFDGFGTCQHNCPSPAIKVAQEVAAESIARLPAKKGRISNAQVHFCARVGETKSKVRF